MTLSWPWYWLSSSGIYRRQYQQAQTVLLQDIWIIYRSYNAPFKYYTVCIFPRRSFIREYMHYYQNVLLVDLLYKQWTILFDVIYHKHQTQGPIAIWTSAMSIWDTGTAWPWCRLAFQYRNKLKMVWLCMFTCTHVIKVISILKKVGVAMLSLTYGYIVGQHILVINISGWLLGMGLLPIWTILSFFTEHT